MLAAQARWKKRAVLIRIQNNQVTVVAVALLLVPATKPSLSFGRELRRT
jgi:hypothetical protein